MKILIINKDIEEVKKILNLLSFKNSEIKIVGIAQNELEFFNLVNNVSFDIILIDLTNKTLIYSRIINYLSLYTTIFLIDKQQYLNKKYKNIITNFKYIIKSDSNEQNINSINSIISDISNTNLKIYYKIEEELLTLGYDFKHHGTQYLIDTILYIYQSQNHTLYNLDKEIYPIISKKYNKTSNTLKCNIRNATELMYYNNNEEKIRKYFINILNFKKPTPKIVISTILKKLK